MFQPAQMISASASQFSPWGNMVRRDDNYTLPVPPARLQGPNEVARAFVEIFAEDTLTITLPDGHTFFGTEDNTCEMTMGDCFQYFYMGDLQWGRRG